jgi:hypothetical protein
MKASEVMTQDVVTIRSSATITDILTKSNFIEQPREMLLEEKISDPSEFDRLNSLLYPAPDWFSSNPVNREYLTKKMPPVLN